MRNRAPTTAAPPAPSRLATDTQTRPRSRRLSPTPVAGTGLTAALLVGVLVLAALLRLPWLDQAPPGLNQDEAANAWNAWCLLKTGTDQVGEPWPIFYMRALGENRSALFTYFVLPFQALGGINVWTTRLPAALSGIATVLLIYWIATRLFTRPVGLLAALLLALNPAHIVLSRLGLEAAIAPLLAAIVVAAVIWAGLPVTDHEAQPRMARFLVAGLITGICCYGYAAVRLLVPVLLAAGVLCTLPSWLQLVRSRRGVMAVGAFALGLAVTFGPLIYQHVAHPEAIAKRAAGKWVWSPSDPLSSRVARVLHRYAGHFGPDFLWITGEHNEMFSPAGFGAYGWYTLPLMPIGLVAVASRLRRSRSARMLLCLVLTYPAGDCLNTGLVLGHTSDGTPIMSMHTLRSAPGLNAPILLSALGAAAAGAFLWRRSRRATMVAATLALAGTLTCAGLFANYYFGAHTRRPAVYHSFQTDLVEATRWLQPRLDEVDAVFVTGTGMNMAHVVMLAVLSYDPQRWFTEPRDILPRGEWDYCFRAGKLYFYFPQDRDAVRVMRKMARDDRPQRVILLVRPGEQGNQAPSFTIHAPPGARDLAVYEMTL